MIAMKRIAAIYTLLLCLSLNVQAQKWIGAITDEDAHIPSNRNYVGTGTLNQKGKPDFKAAHPLASQSILLRRNVRVNSNVRRATIDIAGLGFYELSIGGKKVGDAMLAPLWSDYDKTVFYNTYDITKYLRRGANDVSVLLGNGFYNEHGQRYSKMRISYGPPTLWCKITVEYTNNKRQTIVSDGTWQWAKSPVTFNSIYGGEDYDARITPTGWQKAVVQRGPKGQLRPQQAAPIKLMERFDVQKRLGTDVLDMGQNLSGFPEITVQGKPGQQVRMWLSETLTKDGKCNQKQTGKPYYLTYIIGSDQPETWHPRFTYYGYRYIQLDGAVMEGDLNPDSLPVLKKVQSCFVYNSARKTGNFQCSNEIFNKAYKLIDRAVRSNWQGVWTDCPHREKLGWLEQDWLNGEGLVYNYDCRDMIKQTMQNIVDAQHNNGAVPTTAPEYIHFKGKWLDPFAESPEWGGAVVALPFLYKEHYGDASLIKKYYREMCRYVDYLATKDSLGILKQGLGDWYDYGKGRSGFSQNTPMPLVATAHQYKWTKMMVEAAEMMNDAARIQRYTALADTLAKAFNRDFLHVKRDKQGNVVGAYYGTNSQCANAIALDMQLTPRYCREAVLKSLVDDIRSRGTRLTTGDVGTRYLFRALLDNGQGELWYEMLNHNDVPGYGFQIQKGMTTLTEQWNPEMGASMNHFMMAHINNHLIPDILGIRIDENGQYSVTPKALGNLTWAKGYTMAPDGQRISVEWHKLADGTLKVNVKKDDSQDDDAVQNDYAHNYTRSLHDVMKDVAKRFGVRFKYNVDTLGLTLPYADYRIRAYSLEETLTNICKYFHFAWWKQKGNLYKIKPYEYPRRKTEDGEKLLAYLSSLYADKAQFEARRDSLRREVRERLELDVYIDSLTHATPVLGKVRQYDGYTVQDIRIETLPGEHVFGSIYTPTTKGKHPLIICPDGHFGGGRYRADEQQRLGTLARMGAICVDFDLYGWGQSEAEYGKGSHQTDRAHVIQAMNALVLLDYMWNNRKDVDKDRVGVNGGSGGGTHTVLLSVLDQRFKAAAPTVCLASHFDGGCPCESGKPVQMAAGGTSNVELAACFAPNPLLVVSDGGDWTASVPTLEYPYLQRIYGFFDAKDQVENVHLPKEGHDFGPNKRQAVYDFFARIFSLDITKADESKVTIEPAETFVIIPAP